MRLAIKVLQSPASLQVGWCRFDLAAQLAQRQANLVAVSQEIVPRFALAVLHGWRPPFSARVRPKRLLDNSAERRRRTSGFHQSLLHARLANRLGQLVNISVGENDNRKISQIRAATNKPH